MKKLIFALAFLITISSHAQPSDEAVVDFCNTLQLLSNDSTVSTQTLVLYFATYLSLKEKYPTAEGCDSYFGQIRENFAEEINDWNIAIRDVSADGEEEELALVSMTIQHQTKARDMGEDELVPLEPISELTEASGVLTLQEIAVYGNVLQKLANEAIDSNNTEHMILYYTAYEAFRQYHKPMVNTKEYFTSLREAYPEEIDNWVVGIVLEGFVAVVGERLMKYAPVPMVVHSGSVDDLPEGFLEGLDAPSLVGNSTINLLMLKDMPGLLIYDFEGENGEKQTNVIKLDEKHTKVMREKKAGVKPTTLRKTGTIKKEFFREQFHIEKND